MTYAAPVQTYAAPVQTYAAPAQTVSTNVVGVTTGAHRVVGMETVGFHETVEQMVEMVPKTHQVVHKHEIQESIVEVPQIHTVEKVVQVPHIQEVVRHVDIPVPQIQEVVRHVPR